MRSHVHAATPVLCPGADVSSLQLCPAMEDFRRVRTSALQELDAETLADPAAMNAAATASSSSASSSAAASAAAAAAAASASRPAFEEMQAASQFDSQLDLDLDDGYGGDDADADEGGVDADELDRAIAQEEKLLSLIEVQAGADMQGGRYTDM